MPLFVITHNEIPGYHFWDNAPERLSFLRNRHRHIFVIRCKLSVKSEDREREIIDAENKIRNYLLRKYGNLMAEIELGEMSCEMLARELADMVDAAEVEVLEDGRGGACYVNAGE